MRAREIYSTLKCLPSTAYLLSLLKVAPQRSMTTTVGGDVQWPSLATKPTLEKYSHCFARATAEATSTSTRAPRIMYVHVVSVVEGKSRAR